MDQRIGPIDDVIATVTELVDGTIDWVAACQRLPAYDGVQAVDWGPGLKLAAVLKSSVAVGVGSSGSYLS